MKPTGPSQDIILEHLTHGMMAVILDGRVLLEDPDGVEAIMVRKNLDNDLNLPDHEMALLKHVRTAINGSYSELPPVLVDEEYKGKKQLLWKLVRKKVGETLAGKWQDGFLQLRTYVRTPEMKRAPTLYLSTPERFFGKRTYVLLDSTLCGCVRTYVRMCVRTYSNATCIMIGFGLEGVTAAGPLTGLRKYVRTCVCPHVFDGRKTTSQRLIIWPWCLTTRPSKRLSTSTSCSSTPAS